MLQCLDRFCDGVVCCCEEEYLRAPSDVDLRRILARSEARGLPGMMGSIDCAKWYWKNCPTAYHGQYQGKEGEAALTVEVIADDQLWIWHYLFGMPDCANDINVLEASTLSTKIADGTYPPSLEYEINEEKRSIPYWLADGIYPRWPCFVQTVSQRTKRKEKLIHGRMPRRVSKGCRESVRGSTGEMEYRRSTEPLVVHAFYEGHHESLCASA